MNNIVARCWAISSNLTLNDWAAVYIQMYQANSFVPRNLGWSCCLLPDAVVWSCLMNLCQNCCQSNESSQSWVPDNWKLSSSLVQNSIDGAGHFQWPALKFPLRVNSDCSRRCQSRACQSTQSGSICTSQWQIWPWWKMCCSQIWEINDTSSYKWQLLSHCSAKPLQECIYNMETTLAHTHVHKTHLLFYNKGIL